MLKNNGMVKLVAVPKNAPVAIIDENSVTRNFFWAFQGMENINEVFQSLKDEEYTFIDEDQNFEYYCKHF